MTYKKTYRVPSIQQIKIIYNYFTSTDILRDKTLDSKFMYTPKIDKQNYPFNGLKLLVEMFGVFLVFNFKVQDKLSNFFYKEVVSTFLLFI